MDVQKRSALNRKQKRFMLFSKPIKAIAKLICNDKDDKPVVKAYLHPTKGWKGNKKIIAAKGYKTRKFGRNK